MRITLTSVLVDDRKKAERFYTDVLGLVKKHDGIPFTQFTVDDVKAEYERPRGLGVRFTQEPAWMGNVTTAVCRRRSTPEECGM